LILPLSSASDNSKMNAEIPKHFQYKSSRAPSGQRTFSFQDALLSGYAPDGGLFVPVEIPQINKETLLQWSQLTYPELVIAIAQLYIAPSEIHHSDLSGKEVTGSRKTPAESRTTRRNR
jgi:threonine synthase